MTSSYLFTFSFPFNWQKCPGKYQSSYIDSSKISDRYLKKCTPAILKWVPAPFCNITTVTIESHASSNDQPQDKSIMRDVIDIKLWDSKYKKRTQVFIDTVAVVIDIKNFQRINLWAFYVQTLFSTTIIKWNSKHTWRRTSTWKTAATTFRHLQAGTILSVSKLRTVFYFTYRLLVLISIIRGLLLKYLQQRSIFNWL